VRDLIAALPGGRRSRRGPASDFAVEVAELGRFRVNVYEHERGSAAALRRVPAEPPVLETLALPAVVSDLCARERGLVLVTGPTGSGKTTTLAAMVDAINHSRDGHVLTLEDPIEFLHVSRRCLVTQREVGRHAESFSEGLRSALREDPDVILVGEMRDLETIALTLTAAETGHLVLGTLHARSAAKTVDRIVDVFPADQQRHVRAMLAESLEAVLAQTLVPRRGGGRVAAVEVLVATPAVRNLIREGKSHQLPSVMQTSQRSGMQTLVQAVAELKRSRVIEEAFAAPIEDDAESSRRR
jgi:twitching motility protein PilT